MGHCQQSFGTIFLATLLSILQTSKHKERFLRLIYVYLLSFLKHDHTAIISESQQIKKKKTKNDFALDTVCVSDNVKHKLKSFACHLKKKDNVKHKDRI
jgi:hypothetical protein